MTRFVKIWGIYRKPIGRRVTLSHSFLLAQAIFEPNLFPYKYPNISQN